MTKPRIEPGPYECVAFLNLDATREEDPQGMNRGPANSDAGDHESQTGQLERNTGTIDASDVQEADQHADQPKDVRDTQGQ